MMITDTESTAATAVITSDASADALLVLAKEDQQRGEKKTPPMTATVDKLYLDWSPPRSRDACTTESTGPRCEK